MHVGGMLLQYHLRHVRCVPLVVPRVYHLRHVVGMPEVVPINYKLRHVVSMFPVVPNKSHFRRDRMKYQCRPVVRLPSRCHLRYAGCFWKLRWASSGCFLAPTVPS